MSRIGKCEEVRAYLPDLADGELSIARRREIEAHLALCPSCREEAAAIKESLEILASREPVDPGPAFWTEMHQRVHRRIDASPGRSIFSRPLPASSLAAAALLLVVFLWWALPGGFAPGDPQDYFAQMQSKAEQSLADLGAEIREDDSLAQALIDMGAPSAGDTKDLLTKLDESQLERLAERLEDLMG